MGIMSRNKKSCVELVEGTYAGILFPIYSLCFPTSNEKSKY